MPEDPQKNPARPARPEVQPGNPTEGPWQRRIVVIGDGMPWTQHEQFVTETGKAAVTVAHDGSPEGVANAMLMLRGVNMLHRLNKAAAKLDADLKEDPDGYGARQRFETEVKNIIAWSKPTADQREETLTRALAESERVEATLSTAEKNARRR